MRTSICLYCGSNAGNDPAFSDAAHALGTLMGRQGRHLVYGGGKVGLMGIAADAVMAEGGSVTGIIPDHLMADEVGHLEITRLLVVDSMHTRKRLMFEKSEAFIVLPGGIGTLDELMEIITWRQLQVHDKPVVIVDVAGYWAPLSALLQHIIDRGLAKPAMLSLFKVVDDVASALAVIDAAAPPKVEADPSRV